MFGTEYRPLDFESVLGLSNIKDILRATLREQVYDLGYLFAGPFSTGKTTLARIFARSILCTNRREDMSPCNECQSCKDFLADRNTGYLEVDAANWGTKENIKGIKEDLQYESVSSYKIVLMDEAHAISKEGKDAFLGQLEKEGMKVIIMLCTTEYSKMPGTLASRCCQLHLNEPTEKDIVKKLQKICELRGIKCDSEALFTIVQSSGRHYRDAENKLKTVSLLGDVNIENAEKVVRLYKEQIAAILLTLPYDLSRCMQVADQLVSRMSVQDLYDGILRMLNDTIKYMSGITFDSERYTHLLKCLKKQLGTGAFEVLDYILSKNRLNNLTLFQSDLLVLHYRFMRGSFEPKATKGPQETAEEKDSESDTQKENRKGNQLLKGMENLPPWQKEDRVRQFKQQKIQKGTDDRVDERVSQAWGPEKKEDAPQVVTREPLSREDFQHVVGGNLNGKKV